MNRFCYDISLIVCKYFPNWAHFKLYLKCAGGERGLVLTRQQGPDHAPVGGVSCAPLSREGDTPLRMCLVKGCGSPCSIKPEDLVAPVRVLTQRPSRGPRGWPAGDGAQVLWSRLLAGKRGNEPGPTEQGASTRGARGGWLHPCHHPQDGGGGPGSSQGRPPHPPGRNLWVTAPPSA